MIDQPNNKFDFENGFGKKVKAYTQVTNVSLFVSDLITFGEFSDEFNGIPVFTVEFRRGHFEPCLTVEGRSGDHVSDADFKNVAAFLARHADDSVQVTPNEIVDYLKSLEYKPLHDLVAARSKEQHRIS